MEPFAPVNLPNRTTVLPEAEGGVRVALPATDPLKNKEAPLFVAAKPLPTWTLMFPVITAVKVFP